jgi:hypothetical protein
MTMDVTSPIDSVWGQTITRFFSLLPAWHCTRGCVGVMRGKVTTSQIRGTRGAQCLSSWWEVAAQWLNWRYQLRNGWGGSNKDNGGNDNNNNSTETTTRKTASTEVRSIGINAGMDTAAALCQGLTMQGKRILHQR